MPSVRSDVQTQAEADETAGSYRRRSLPAILARLLLARRHQAQRLWKISIDGGPNTVGVRRLLPRLDDDCCIATAAVPVAARRPQPVRHGFVLSRHWRVTKTPRSAAEFSFYRHFTDRHENVYVAATAGFSAIRGKLAWRQQPSKMWHARPGFRWPRCHVH
jgi:hypothetical protein